MRGRRLLSSCWAFLAWVAATYCSGQGVAPPAASAEPTGLKVQVIGSAQESIAGERYVAVVPEGQPPSRPVREAVLAKDEPSPSWQLEPGRYRVLCLALGYNGAWLDATELVPGRRQDLQCVLEPTVRVRGRVVAAADGSPVGGGRVRSAHLVAPLVSRSPQPARARLHVPGVRRHDRWERIVRDPLRRQGAGFRYGRGSWVRSAVRASCRSGW